MPLPTMGDGRSFQPIDRSGTYLEVSRYSSPANSIAMAEVRWEIVISSHPRLILYNLSYLESNYWA
jgi:hypothetical protein